MLRMRRHAVLRLHRIALICARLLLGLEVCLVLQRLFGYHGIGRHAWVARHSGLLALYLAMGVFWRLDRLVAFDAIFVGLGFGCVEAGLDEVLAFWLRDQRLQLGCCEGVDKASLGDDEQQHLGAGEDGQFVGLLHDTGLSLGEGDVSPRLVLDELDLNLSSLPARLVIIIVVVVGSRTRTLRASIGVASQRAVAVADIVVAWRWVLIVVGNFRCHDVYAEWLLLWVCRSSLLNVGVGIA